MRILLTLFLFFIWVCSAAQVFEVKTIKDAGPVEQRINFVILPDGYTAGELGKFQTDAQFVVDEIFKNSFFAQYSDFINVHIILVPSNESGASHPGTANDEPAPGTHPIKEVDNYFGSRFDVGGVHRLLVATNSSAVYNVLASNFPSYDQIFVLVNSEYYGGAGGQIATSSVGVNAVEIAIHEIGHSFVGLADEYEYAGSTPREALNATQETEREKIRWNIWIEEDTPVPTPEFTTYASVVGLFEGAVYRPTDWYRPKLNCKMRSLGIPFCEVCAESFVLRFHELSPPVQNRMPAANEVTITGEQTLDFSVDLVGFGSVDYSLSWTLNGEELDIQSPSFSIEFDDTEMQTNTVELLVRDTTDLVRKEVIEYTETWVINGFVKGQDYNPEVTSFDPMTATAGETVQISGLNFNESAENVEVSINEIPLNVVDFENNVLTVEIPINNLEGAFKVVINGEEAISPEIFKTKPTITDFNPKSGEIGATITIDGTNFSDTPEDNLVRFGSIQATTLSSENTTMQIMVPENAPSGKLLLEVNGVLALSAEVFEVLVITSLPDQSPIDQISLFPNPTDGKITLLIPETLKKEDVRLEIYTTNGKFLRGLDMDLQEPQINLKGLASGAYIVNIIAGDQKTSRPLIIN